MHRGSRPQGPEPKRFEAPRRNALWQLDFAEVRVHGLRLHVLLILDDFSRYIVGHALGDNPSSEVATQTLRQAIARHGKPGAWERSVSTTCVTLPLPSYACSTRD